MKESINYGKLKEIIIGFIKDNVKQYRTAGDIGIGKIGNFT